MATIRKYSNNEGGSGSWENIASSEATGVVTKNIILTKNPNSEVNIEEVLCEHEANINLLKKNVSWLALHGGGGYGGGSGSSSTTTAKVIIIGSDGNPTDRIVWTNSTRYIKYKVSSRSTSARFRTVVKLNGRTILTQLVEKNREYIVSKDALGTISSASTLQVYAYDEENNEYFASCSIIVPGITINNISTTDAETVVVQSDLPNLTLNKRLEFRVAIPGRYFLLYSTSSIILTESSLNNLKNNGYFLDLGEIEDVNSRFVEISLKNPSINSAPLIPDDAGLGTIPINFIIVSADDFNVFSNIVTFTVSIVLTRGLAIIPLVGLTENTPLQVPRDGSFNIKFKIISVEGNSGNASWRISVDGNQELGIIGQQWPVGENPGSSKIGSTVTQMINLSSVIDKNTAPAEAISVVFNIYCYNANYSATANIYITATGTDTERLEKYLTDIPIRLGSTVMTIEKEVFDYTVDGNGSHINSFNENQGSIVEFEADIPSISQRLGHTISSGTRSKFTIYDRGIDTTYDGYSISVNHRSYIEISTTTDVNFFPTNGQDYGSVIPASDTGFTLDIAYWVGDVNEDGILFSLGGYDPDNPNSGNTGIIIKPEEYYVKILREPIIGKLQKNSFYHLCIVFDPEKKQIEIFKNGVYDKVITETGDFFPNLGGIKKIILGCNEDQSGKKNFLNFKLYSVRLYNTVFNVGQVLCSYINNVVCNDLIDGAKNAVLFNHLLEINQINRDSLDLDVISSIYDFKTGTYNWGLNNIGDVPQSLKNLAIPLVVIDCPDWRYESFIQNKAPALIHDPAENATLYYKAVGDENFLTAGTNFSSSGHAVEVKIQGTTTTEYVMKNIDITFKDYLFSPKDSWLPEQSFTLKADVIDSGHYNNAVIGRFVNDCLNNTELLNRTAFPNYGIFNQLKSNGKYPSTITAKQCIEGFPIMLAMKFAGDSDIRVLGVYSFNLGRNSVYNMGFIIPTEFRDVDRDELTGQTHVLDINNISFPRFFGIPQNFNSTYKSLCYEGNLPFNSRWPNGASGEEYLTPEQANDSNVTINYHFIKVKVGEKQVGNTVTPIYQTYQKQQIGVYNNNGTYYVGYSSGYDITPLLNDKDQQILWNSSNIVYCKICFNGYFWSDHESYASDLLWREVYNGYSGSEASSGRRQFEVICKEIATRLPYNKGGIQFAAGSSWQQYSITGVLNSSGELTDVQPTPNGGTVTISFPQSDGGTTGELKLSVKNAAFYYVVALLFGLTDSFGKNLQMKSWRSAGGNDLWSPTFYDMDTALGLGNKGLENVPSTLLDFHIYNTPNNNCYTIYGDHESAENEITSVYSNKLWGFDGMTVLQQQMSIDFPLESGNEGNYYATMWSMLRKTVLKDVDSFIDGYINTQISNCSQFLINQDFEVKYFNSDIDKLNGTRLDFIKIWLRDRINFLDSVFDFLTISKLSNYLSDSLSHDLDPYEVPFLERITLTNSSNKTVIPIVTKSPVIIKTELDAVTSSYKFVPKNVETEIVAGFGNTPNVNTVINNSSLIKKIGLTEGFNLISITSSQYPVWNKDGTSRTDYYISNGNNNSATVEYYNYANFRSLTTFNLSGAQHFSSTNFNLFRLFKTWDNSGLGKETDPFLLEEINFSGLIPSGNTQINLTLDGTDDTLVPDVYRNPFKNLTKIDVSNSQISSLTIPTGVSLVTLNILGSQVTEIDLTGQPLLNPVNFGGCAALKDVTINNCDKFTKITFNSDNQSLKNLNISNCKNLTEIEIKGYYNNLQDIYVGNCEKLTKFTLTSNSSSSLSPSSPTITIENSDLLNEIEISNCSGSPNNISIYNCKNLRTLKITKSSYTTVITDTSFAEVLNTLNLSESSVKTFKTQPDSPDNEVDLRIFTNLTTVNCGSNSAVEVVRFLNDETNPITLSSSGTFNKCTSLRRVYGNLILTKSNTFSKCPELRFTVTTGGTTTFNGVQVKNGQKWLHPYDIDGMVDKNNNNKINFYSGNDKINIQITSNGAKSLFAGEESGIKGAPLDNFEMYYFLYCLDQSVTSIDSIFASLKNDTGVRNFNWVNNSVDNSPHRRMYEKCVNVTSWGAIYYQTALVESGQYYRIYSPTYNTNNGTWNNDGLYSPLKKLKNTNFGGFMGGVCDRNIFKGQSNFSFELLTLSPSLIVNDVNSLTKTESDALRTHSISDRIITPDELDQIGNIDGIFDNCPNIQTFEGFSGSALIDFGKTGDDGYPVNPGFTNKLVTIRHAFRGIAMGTLDLHNLFKRSDTTAKKLKRITDSFVYSNYITINSNDSSKIEKLNFELNEGTFEGFSQLTNLAIIDTSTTEINPGTYTTPFVGNGLNKLIIVDSSSDEVDLPDILGNTSQWSEVEGLFRGAKLSSKTEISGEIVYNELTSKLRVPGDLFIDQTRLTSVHRCFQDLDTKFILTGEGFSNCPNLKDVSYLFYRTSKKKNCLSSPIPYKLFYHGERVLNSTLVGTNWEHEILVTAINNGTARVEAGGEVTYYRGYNNSDEENKIILTPVTETWTNSNNTHIQVGNQLSQWGSTGLSVETYTNRDSYGGNENKYYYYEPIRSITKIDHCFCNLDISLLSDDQDYYEDKTPIDNSSFSPYKYSLTGSKWSKNPNRNLDRYTLMWEYNGDWLHYNTWHTNKEAELLTGQDSGYSIEYLDDIPINESNNICTSGNGFLETQVDTMNTFCTPPDLLRYCVNTISLTSLFEGCGTQHLNEGSLNQLERDWKDTWFDSSYGYGLRGRLCPYLLKPVKQTKVLDSMFKYCRWVGYYTKTTEGNGASVSKSYVIPESFFKYLTPDNSTDVISLDSTFEGITLPLKAATGVFIFGKPCRIKIDRIFANVKYQGSSSNRVKITNVFKNSNLSSINSAFRLDIDSTSYGNPRKQYVEFDDVFNTSSNCTRSATYVFAGFASADEAVLHESHPTVRGEIEYHNYDYADVSIQEPYTGRP